ncbi:MAG: S9 family peptidase, partial [Acidobacteria bacterium]|nr:S9 family peptidase [Acidobacteriota bacterium]NIM63487.1 S9 family peptidase [Acidobacteriota bacterium]NIO58425.1 S9 family peptidase [Acidobacteriota bacterium]NIQ29480.1 S9 family peptidase [Acidobacteriota bacterium]NIQ84139.1 S9 family peptidase [Acidobacteriota bacterium]
SPDGSLIAYTLTVPRRPGHEDNGPARTVLRVAAADGSWDRAYLGEDAGPSDIRFTPDGTMLTYLAKRKDDGQRAIWAIPVAGGESRKLLEFETDISSHRVSPDGKRIAFL